MLSLKQARVGVDMTQQEIAERLGVTTATYRRYENNIETMPTGLLLKFCEIVKQTPDIFLCKDQT